MTLLPHLKWWYSFILKWSLYLLRYWHFLLKPISPTSAEDTASFGGKWEQKYKLGYVFICIPWGKKLLIMQSIVENVFCHNNFIECCYLMQLSLIQIAVTRADFTRTSVTDPSVTTQCNSISTKFLLSAPKEVFTSKINSLSQILPNGSIVQ